MTTRGDRLAVAFAALFLGGCALNVLAYGTYAVLPVATALFAAGSMAVVVGPLAGGFERRAYFGAAGVGWFMAGIAAIYARFYDDPYQIGSDARTLYDLAAGRAGGLGLEEISTLAEGSGAITAWRALYRLSSGMGLGSEPFVGIAANTVVVALAGAVIVRSIRTLFPGDAARLHHAVLLVCGCGLLWMFAAIHLRDAFVLLSVSVLLWIWIRYLTAPFGARLVELSVATVLGIVFLGFFRTEFAFLPLVLLAAGVGALTVAPAGGSGARRALAWAAAGIGAVVFAALYARVGSEMFTLLALASENYSQLSAANAEDGSLGVALVTSQPLPIKMIVGSIYLLVFPIPFWSGFTTGSAYHLFKSANVLYFYILVPMMALGVVRLARAQRRSAPLVFLAFVTVGILMAVAATSLENRHIGAFLLPLIALALVPDPTASADRRALHRLWSAYFVAVAFVHVAWLALRFA